MKRVYGSGKYKINNHLNCPILGNNYFMDLFSGLENKTIEKILYNGHKKNKFKGVYLNVKIKVYDANVYDSGIYNNPDNPRYDFNKYKEFHGQIVNFMPYADNPSFNFDCYFFIDLSAIPDITNKIESFDLILNSVYPVVFPLMPIVDNPVYTAPPAPDVVYNPYTAIRAAIPEPSFSFSSFSNVPVVSFSSFSSAETESNNSEKNDLSLISKNDISKNTYCDSALEIITNESVQNDFESSLNLTKIV